MEGEIENLSRKTEIVLGCWGLFWLDKIQTFANWRVGNWLGNVF